MRFALEVEQSSDQALRDYHDQLVRNHHMLSRIPTTHPQRLAELCENLLLVMGELHRRRILSLDDATDGARKWYKLQVTYEEETQKMQQAGVQASQSIEDMNTKFVALEGREDLANQVAKALEEALTTELKDVVHLGVHAVDAAHVEAEVELSTAHHPAIPVFAQVGLVLDRCNAYRKVRVTVLIKTVKVSYFTVGG